MTKSVCRGHSEANGLFGRFAAGDVPGRMPGRCSLSFKSLLAALCAVSACIGFGETLRTAAGAAPGYSFYTAPDDGTFYPWTSDGENGAKSGGYHVDYVNSWMDVVVLGPATVTFEWRASSESVNWDWLAFYDNGVENDKIGGETEWQSKTYEISDSNVHVIRFLYRKDGSCDEGSDCGWVRNFQVTRSSDLLPADYIQYAYLHADGDAAINSDYDYASNSRIDVEWDLDSASSLGGLSLPSGASTLTCRGSSAYFCNCSGDSQVYSIGGTGAGSSCPLFLLDQAGGMTPGDGEKIVGDIYSFRILDSSGAVQRNMIPCKRIADDVAGFYDTVGGGFYPSVTATAFTAVSRVGGYIITLNANGGEGGTTGVKAMGGGELPAITCPTKSGADFLGYFDEGIGKQYYDLAGYGVCPWDQDDDKTLTARWDSENVSLFLPKGETGTSYAVTNGTTGAEVGLYCVTADGRLVYRLPSGSGAAVYCVPSAGCTVRGTNPYVIDSVTPGMTVGDADLPQGVTPTQLALETIFDTANSPTTVKQIRDESDALLGHRVTLGRNYGDLTIGEDLGSVTLDLNGWKISGGNGANGSDTVAGANGVAAVTVSGTGVGAGATAIVVENNTTPAEGRPASGPAAGIVGGNAGWGQPGGTGAYGIADSSGAQFAQVSGATSLVAKGVNGRTIIDVPSQVGTLTYTGYVQYPTWTSSVNMSFGGTTSGIEVQTYTALVTPDSTHCWSGGSTVTKYVNWTISEAVLPEATARAKNELESIFDAVGTATTVKPLFTEGGELVGLRVVLGQNYGPLTIPADLGAVTIDLNGWMIEGAPGADGEGSQPGGDGGPAMTVSGASGAAAGETAITVENNIGGVGARPAPGPEAGIVGGRGGSGADGAMPGNGGLAIVDADGVAYGNVTDSLGLVKRGAGGLLSGVVPDPTSDYAPTAIVNGGFDEEPWEDFEAKGERWTFETTRDNPLRNGEAVTQYFPNGPGEGWNTTESTVYGPGLFEIWQEGVGSAPSGSHGRFIEMNANHSAVFYQDLHTYGGDVIRWSLRHGYRGYAPESIRVEIGEPVGPASGVGSAVNANIRTETKAVYTSEGVTNPSGVEYGYDGELANLSISSYGWHDAYGIYLIPEGQDVTRFAFIAITGSSLGNFLDDLTFSTLIGNLKARAEDDGSVVLTGYWGDADTTKHLRLEFGGQSYDLDMSGVLNQNFAVTLPYTMIGNARELDVYHQDYPLAKRAVVIQHPEHFTIQSEGAKFRGWCTNSMHSVETGCPYAGEDNAVEVLLAAEDRMYTGTPYVGASLVDETGAWADAGLPQQPAYSYAVRGSSDFSATAPTAVGLYTVKATIRDVSATADFEITKAQLTVTADDKTVRRGYAPPAYTATVTGFVNGESESVACSGVPEFTCAYAPGTDDGAASYPITPARGSLESSNYEFVDFRPGTLTVGTIGLTLDDVKVADGDPWRTITVDYTLSGVDPSAYYRVVFEITADGETRAVTNAPALLTDGPASQVVDTATLFGLPGADPHAKVRVALVEPVTFDEKDYALMPESWQVGDDAWAFMQDGALCVFGTGATWDFSSRALPWQSQAMSVRSAVVGNLVTEIGNRFFKKCYKMSAITCGGSVVRFRERAFYLCTALERIQASNPAFELDCLKDSIIYQMAVELNTGKFIMIPDVRINGAQPMLYGKENITDPVWRRIGPLEGQNLDQLKADGVYHFFQTRLEGAGN